MDPNVSTTMNGFLIVANIINLIYNVPQIITTYKRKTTRDFSGTFLLMRFVGNIIWIAYAVEVDSLLMLINNIVTVLSSAFVGYYKVVELYGDYKKSKKYKSLDNNNSIKTVQDEEIINIPINVISVEHNKINNNQIKEEHYLVDGYLVDVSLDHNDNDHNNLL